MADDNNTQPPTRSRKRKRTKPLPILPPDQKVEVRSIEDGFQGSWHRAKVISSKKQTRVVRYEHIFDDDGCTNLVESVTILCSSVRGRIRRVPPRLEYNFGCLHYGQCVDVFHKDAWWEGVVFDHNDMSDERSVFFPDIGDELVAGVKKIRLTRDWNVDTGVWKFRGDWVFLEVLEELELEWPILVSLKQIWYELRLKKQFVEEIKEWTCEIKEIWKESVKEVILDNLKLTMVEFFGRLQREGNRILDIKPFLDLIVKIKPSFFTSSEALVPIVSNHRPLESELVHVDDDDDDDDDGDMGPPGFSKNELVDNRDEDIDMGPSGFSKNELVVSASSRLDEQCLYEWTELRDFAIFQPDVLVEPEWCPDSVSEHYKLNIRNVRPPRPLMLKVRQHLLYLGWKIELKRDHFGAKHKESNRYRYTSPTGKHYVSLTVVCADLCKDLSELPPSPPPLPSPTQQVKVDLDPEYCPQAVDDYLNVTPEESYIVRLELARRARKHLLAVGWSLFYVDGTERQGRSTFESPNGRRFHSILTACKYYVSENCCKETNNGFEVKSEGGEGERKRKKTKVDVNILPTEEGDGEERSKEKGVGKLIIKKKDGVLSIKALEKRKESSLKSTDKDSKKSSRKSRVLRSSKRAREDISPMHQTPRTVLSWLIDNAVIVPRSKVIYRCRKDGHTMKEGRVTRDGIKCSCCQMVFSVSKFETHAGSTNRRPSANIYLEDGRSLLDCQFQLKRDRNTKLCKAESQRLKSCRNKLKNENDYICSVCHYGGELVLCDQCPSSFHTFCLGLKEVPDGDWFCPSCCCRICNQNKFSDCEQETDSNILNCEQCERRYHIGCLRRKDGVLNLESYNKVNWFCSTRCEEIYLGINELIDKPIPVGRDDLTWSIIKHKLPVGSDHDPSNMEEIAESYSKLNIAVSVMHECFDPVIEPTTQRDIVEDVIFCRWSDLGRLNFKGFYTVLLEKDDELVSAATVRIYGEKVAELPLIGTRVLYRKRGMCHALMDVLEKKLAELGVERLVLPAVPSVLHTWTSSFGFSVMTEAQKLEFLGYTFLDFQGTHMCQKLLGKAQPSADSSISRGNVHETANGSNAMDLDGVSAVSEVSQAERADNMMVNQHCLDIGQCNQANNNSTSEPQEIVTNQPSHVECQSEISVECTMEASNTKEDDGNNEHMKCYHRRKIVACES